MAGNKRPSYLKRQKEQQRMARATAKREARRLRKQSKGQRIEGFDEMIASSDQVDEVLGVGEEREADEAAESVENGGTP